MPKKTKKDKILEEIAAKLKEIKNKESFGEEERDIDEDEESEKSGPEEDLELNLEDLQFHQFMQPSEPSGDRAPVLERIAGSQPRPIFVGGISQTPQTIPGEEKKSDELKYVPGQEGNNEPKYIESDSRISREPTHVDLMKVGREPIEMVPQVDQEAFFMRSEPGSQIEPLTSERQWKTERIDVERAGREDPFKKEEIKYEKYKPKHPKSY